MNDVTAPTEAQASYAKKAWQSDVIVDLIKHYNFPFIALNPGRELSRAARFAGQLRRQSAANSALSA